MNCTAVGSPEPMFEWTHNGVLIERFTTRISFADGYIRMLSAGQLIELSNLQETHSGHWKCVAKNELGSAERHFHLHVVEPPYFKRFDNGTKTTNEHEELSLPLGKSKTLECPVLGTDPIKIEWRIGGQKLMENRWVCEQFIYFVNFVCLIDFFCKFVKFV